jgi:signal transduction histidine kinase
MLIISSGVISILIGWVCNSLYQALIRFLLRYYPDTFHILKPISDIVERSFFITIMPDWWDFPLWYAILYTIVFLILCNRNLSYFSTIYCSIIEISKMETKQMVPVQYRNELSDLAINMNHIITQSRKAIEEERRAEESKNELITNVSHDLRTPLTSILGYLNLIERDQYKDEVELRYYTNVALKKTEHLNNLVNTLFEYVRTKNPKMHLDIHLLNMNELIRQIQSQFLIQSTPKDLELRFSLPDEPIYLEADGFQLSRVFENILTNAIQYGDNGKFIDFTLLKKEATAVMKIINYGESIPEQDIPYLFDRFYRIEKSRSKETGGTGLGLAIAKNIVDLHHGNISVQSDEFQTIFTIHLPIKFSKDKHE